MEYAGKRNFSHNVPNAFMASSRGHDFWNFCVRQMLVRIAKAQMETYEGEWWDHVEQTAGPAMLHASLQVCTRFAPDTLKASTGAVDCNSDTKALFPNRAPQMVVP